MAGSSPYDPMPRALGPLKAQTGSLVTRYRHLRYQPHPGRTEDQPISPVAVDQILKEEGFARLPRRDDQDRLPDDCSPAARRCRRCRPARPPPANHSIPTKFGGLFLFLPTLATLPFDRIIKQAGLPGSQMIPPASALRSLLALKLLGTARHGYVVNMVLDRGGPLRWLERYPQAIVLDRVRCRSTPELIRHLFNLMGGSVCRAVIPSTWIFTPSPFMATTPWWRSTTSPSRSRRQKGMLAFLARDAEKRVFCYARADIRKQDQADEVLQLRGDFWKRRTGKNPSQALIFDSKLTTYANLNRLNQQDIAFITLRRRSPGLLKAIDQTPRRPGDGSS